MHPVCIIDSSHVYKLIKNENNHEQITLLAEAVLGLR